MTSLASLLASSVQDITIEGVRGLVDQGLPEGLILDYKEAYNSHIVETVAAMANTYGGLIFVGVTDSPPRQLLGVEETVATSIANVCHDSLEPPWVPEIIPLPIHEDGTCLIVVRIDPKRAPRPVLHKGRALVRLHDRVATADRGRLAQLFQEATASAPAISLGVTPPQIDRDADGKPNADFVIRSGIHVPLGERASWRPFSDRVVGRLASVLFEWPIKEPLSRWCDHFGITGVNPFHQEGFNRARHSRLVWQGVSDTTVRFPVEAVIEVDLPSRGGAPTTSLYVTLDMIVKAKRFFETKGPVPSPFTWRLDMPDLYESIDGLIAALTFDDVKTALADLADVDAALVPQPASLHFVEGSPTEEVLNMNGLRPIEGAGTSYGAHMLADPSLDLGSPTDRHQQIDDWLQQMSLDSGLLGMERVLEEYHRSLGQDDPAGRDGPIALVTEAGCVKGVNY